eukprot:CAMPEP_0115542782 /NCGR_PEP_ID=MMETSP0271-20121206/91189_1 /TAXON_ID=71861 /ORGANISM="Scrippsiella trochoidea, Strain CCMP3099" /LENGTH=87 /DNA_ID=CAMNT_0002975955 /DNA_START=90 /DNA_END=353 /DNA_ORIENTATION=+
MPPVTNLALESVAAPSFDPMTWTNASESEPSKVVPPKMQTIQTSRPNSHLNLFAASTGLSFMARTPKRASNMATTAAADSVIGASLF